MSGQTPRAAVIGSTSWGTTLALLLARKNVETLLWTRSSEEAATLNAARENTARLPGQAFPPSLNATDDLQETVGDAELIVVVVPSASFRHNVSLLKDVSTRPDAIILGATKGLERSTGRRMSQVLEEVLGEEPLTRYAVLSGPNLAREIAEGMPSSTVIGALDLTVAERAQALFTSSVFRVYTNTDLLGVELGGSLKNIVAIGAGMVDGMGFGDNAKAAFIARGIAEITRLGVAAGAQMVTFSGLACLGDLIATCYSRLSRNRFVGQELAKGRTLEKVLSELGQVAEGVDTTSAALVLAEGLGVEMPITYQTHRVLHEGVAPKEALGELLARAPKPEDPLWDDETESG